MAPTHKIAIIQLYPKPLNPDLNFGKASNFIRSAASQGAKLAVLPEYHLTGWKPESPLFAEQASQWETYVNGYKALAKECKICIVPGTIVERQFDDEAKEWQLLNVCYFISDNGEVLGKYTKKNLWHPEKDYLTADKSSPHTVIQTPVGPVGLLICWDMAFPEAWRGMIAAGAKIIIAPTFWTLDSAPNGVKRNPQSEAVYLNALVVARAFENTCAVVFVNAGGPAERDYAGLSQIGMPFIGALGKMETSEEAMRVIDVDMNILEEAEEDYKVRAELVKEDWHYVQSGIREQKNSKL